MQLLGLLFGLNSIAKIHTFIKVSFITALDVCLNAGSAAQQRPVVEEMRD